MYSCKCVPVLSGVMVSGRGFLVFDPGVLVMCSSMEGFPDLDGLRCGEEISLVSQSVCCPLRWASVGFGSGVGVPGGGGGKGVIFSSFVVFGGLVSSGGGFCLYFLIGCGECSLIPKVSRGLGLFIFGGSFLVLIGEKRRGCFGVVW